MAYQFGTNWSGFSKFAGGVTGPLLAYEVLTAFFLEAGFLGVMLFGLQRVGPGLHFLSTVMVAVGTLISATWILASNSLEPPSRREAGGCGRTHWSSLTDGARGSRALRRSLGGSAASAAQTPRKQHGPAKASV